MSILHAINMSTFISGTNIDMPTSTTNTAMSAFHAVIRSIFYAGIRSFFVSITTMSMATLHPVFRPSFEPSTYTAMGPCLHYVGQSMWFPLTQPYLLCMQCTSQLPLCLGHSSTVTKTTSHGVRIALPCTSCVI